MPCVKFCVMDCRDQEDGKIIMNDETEMTVGGSVRGCIQKFPDWPPGARTAMVQLSAIRCCCIAIL
jgi:hypothetical protein